MASTFFTLIYPLVPVISVAAYLPQIKALFIASRPDDSVSVNSGRERAKRPV